MLFLLLLACAPVTEPLPQVVCDPDPGQVQWIEGQLRFSSLGRALEMDAPWMTLCLGEGDFEIDDEILELESLTGSIQLIGRGPELTRIVAGMDLDFEGEQLLWPGRPIELVFQELQIATPLEISATALVLESVTLQDIQATGGLLRLDAQDLLLNDLLVQGCSFGFGGIATTEKVQGSRVQVNRLRWLDNVAAAGLHVFFEGERDVRFSELVVENASDLSSSYPMFYGFGDMELIGSSMHRVRAGGPVVSSRVLRMTDTEIREGRSSSGGLIQVAQQLDLDRVSVQDSRSLDSLLSAYKGSLFPLEIHIQDSQFGTQLPNAVPCDLSVAGRCIEESLGAVEDWSCTYCTESL
ncbi:MAG: hypothetical protein ACI9VR_004124 [Cognaticolwellia sp.]